MRKIVADSSSYAMHFKCPLSEYLYKYYNTSGVVGKEEFKDTAFGSIAHDGVESLLMGGSLEEELHKAEFSLNERIPSEQTPDGVWRCQELWWLLHGILRTFNDHYLPSFLQEYKVRAIEQEYVIPLDEEVHWCTRPDATLERRADGAYFNCNIKTSSWMKDLLKIYEFSVQMLMEAHAIKLNQGLDTGGTVILALNKGSKGKLSKLDVERGKSGYRFESPFTYVWWKNGTYSFEWSAKSEKVPVWEFNSTPLEWYEKIPLGYRQSMVSITPPIRHSSSMKYEDVVKDIVFVEKNCYDGKVPRSYDSCNNYGTYNKPCAYRTLCWGTPEEIAATYIPRTSNHPFEETIRTLNMEEL